MISQLKVENFKCFRDPVPVDFKDITLIYGKNSSGKSSLIDAIKLVLPDAESGFVSINQLYKREKNKSREIKIEIKRKNKLTISAENIFSVNKNEIECKVKLNDESLLSVIGSVEAGGVKTKNVVFVDTNPKLKELGEDVIKKNKDLINKDTVATTNNGGFRFNENVNDNELNKFL